MATWESIQAFLQQKRIALVGASRDERHFSRYVLLELQGAGYEVIPVHPEAKQIGTLTAFSSVESIDPPADAALVMTPPAKSAEIVRSCARAGIKYVWLHRGEGVGAVSDEAVQAASELGVQLVPGECPLMFLPKAKWFHRVHKTFKRLNGTLPRPEVTT